MKILVLDDHALFRAGMRLLVAAIESRAEVHEAATLSEAATLTALHPDIAVCLLDLMLAHEGGVSTLTRFKAVAPNVAVVVVSEWDDPVIVQACIDAGAMSFVPKRMPPQTLTRALRQVLGGEAPPGIAMH